MEWTEGAHSRWLNWYLLHFKWKSMLCVNITICIYTAKLAKIQIPWIRLSDKTWCQDLDGGNAQMVGRTSSNKCSTNKEVLSLSLSPHPTTPRKLEPVVNWNDWANSIFLHVPRSLLTFPICESVQLSWIDFIWQRLWGKHKDKWMEVSHSSIMISLTSSTDLKGEWLLSSLRCVTCVKVSFVVTVQNSAGNPLETITQFPACASLQGEIVQFLLSTIIASSNLSLSFTAIISSL